MLFFLIMQIFPPANVFIHISPLLINLSFIGIAFVLFSSLLKSKTIIALLLYFALCLLYFLAGSKFFYAIGTIVYPFQIMMGSVIISEYTFKYDDDYKLTKKLVLLVVVANIVMSIITIPQVLQSPNLIRWATDPEFIEQMGTEYHWIITYSTCHGLPLLIAPLVFLCRRTFRKSTLWFCVWTLVTVSLLYMIYLSNATTPLVIAVIMFALGSLLNWERISKRDCLLIAAGAFVVLILNTQSVMLTLLDSIQSVMDEESSNYQKINEFKDELLYGSSEGDWSARKNLYNKSWFLFIDSPIIGTAHQEDIAHHSWFIDRLACFGILFIAPVVLVFFFHIKSIYRHLIYSKVPYIISVSAWLLMLVLKNDFGQGSWLYGFAFLPIFCRYIDFFVMKQQLKRRNI